jgi:hypothetical protein
MAEIRFNHLPDLSHHVQQGTAWLAASSDGQHTAALSYSALELRFAIERLTIHYWALLLDRQLTDDDLHDFESFNRGQNKIYGLAGHQKTIDAHFNFMRIVLRAIKVDMPLVTPQIGKLAKYWHDCSELCHISWTLSCSIPDEQQAAFASLSEVSSSLSELVASLGWPVLRDNAFVELRNRFVAGEAGAGEVTDYLACIGLWAQVVVLEDPHRRFVGEPLPLNGHLERPTKPLF